MSGEAGAAVLETNDENPKMPDKKKTKFDVVNYWCRSFRIYCRNLLF